MILHRTVGGRHDSYLTNYQTKMSRGLSSTRTQQFCGLERVMGLEPTISCLGSKRSTTELHPRTTLLFYTKFWDRQGSFLPRAFQFYRLRKERQGDGQRRFLRQGRPARS